MSMPDPLAEVDTLLRVHEGKAGEVLRTLTTQFAVLQNRSQVLLTLCTLTLTITGFSGPKIVASGPGARWAMAIGIVLVLLGLILLLLSSLVVRFASQFIAEDADTRAGFARLIEYRNRKTAWYRWQLACIVLGISGYVAAIVHYLLTTP